MNSKICESKLLEINPHLIIHISSNILKSNIYNIAKYGTLNLHHGVLPYIRGLDSMYWGIYYNKQEWVGASIHHINDGIDTGGIVLRQDYNYKGNNSLTDIIISIEKIGTKLMIDAIKKIIENQSKSIVQFNINNSTYSLPLNLYIPNALPAGTPIKIDKTVAVDEIKIVNQRLSNTPAVSDKA